MVPRAATPQAAKAGAPWEHAGRMTSWEEGHGRGEQNLPTSVQSADADDDRAMLREAAYSAGGKRTLGKGKTKAPGRDKPRQNIIYLRGECSRPCWTTVTHWIYRR
jgi:hypothetical protein